MQLNREVSNLQMNISFPLLSLLLAVLFVQAANAALYRRSGDDGDGDDWRPTSQQYSRDDGHRGSKPVRRGRGRGGATRRVASRPAAAISHAEPLHFYLPLHKSEWAGYTDIRMSIAYVVPDRDAARLSTKRILDMARSIYDSIRKYSVAVNGSVTGYSGFVDVEKRGSNSYVFNGPLEPLIKYIRKQLTPKVPPKWSISYTLPRPFVSFDGVLDEHEIFEKVEGLLVKTFDFSQVCYKFRGATRLWSFDTTKNFTVAPSALPVHVGQFGSVTRPRERKTK